MLDLRAEPEEFLAAAGIEWEDYERAPLHDLCRDLAAFFVASGYEWVAFHSGAPQPTWDEWLNLGSCL